MIGTSRVTSRKFLEYIEIERGRAVKTVENYDRYLTRYFSQMKIKDVSDITEQNIRDFRLWLNRQSCERHYRAEYPRLPPVA